MKPRALGASGDVVQWGTPLFNPFVDRERVDLQGSFGQTLTFCHQVVWDTGSLGLRVALWDIFQFHETKKKTYYQKLKWPEHWLGVRESAEAEQCARKLPFPMYYNVI
jgi:hypothetical protein